MPYYKKKWIFNRRATTTKKKEKLPLLKRKDAVFLLSSPTTLLSTSTELRTDDVVVSSFSSNNFNKKEEQNEEAEKKRFMTSLPSSSSSSSSSRPLYTIPEVVVNMVPIIDKQDQRQQIFHHLLTEEETIRSHHQQEEVKDNPMILIEDEEDSTCGYIPLFEWPSSINDKHHFSLNTQLPTEEECKSKFSKMILAAYYQQHLLEQYPKEMHLIFDEQDRQIEGISILFQDNTREDYLELKVSLQYLAPELSISSVYHYEKVEVWSLGISLYQMLVGRYPFIEESLSHREVFNKMLICDYDLPKSLSKDARDLIQRMLSPEHTRASLDLIMFHPWLKSYIPWLNTEEEHKTKKMNYNKSTKIKNSRLRAKKKIKKTVHAVKKIITYIFKGPYPPPSSYHNIVIS